MFRHPLPGKSVRQAVALGSAFLKNGYPQSIHQGVCLGHRAGFYFDFEPEWFGERDDRRFAEYHQFYSILETHPVFYQQARDAGFVGVVQRASGVFVGDAARDISARSWAWRAETKKVSFSAISKQNRNSRKCFLNEYTIHIRL